MRSFGVLPCHSPTPSSPRSPPARRPRQSPRGTSAMTSPVAGLRTSMVSPDVESTKSPPMKCFCWVTDTLTSDLRSVKSRGSVAAGGSAEQLRSFRVSRNRAPCGFSSSERAGSGLPSRRSRDGDPSSSTARSRTTTPLARPRSSPSSTTAASRAHAVDASSKEAIVALIRETRADAVLNSVDPLLQRPHLRCVLRSRRHIPRHGDDALASRIRRIPTRRRGSSSATISSSAPRRGRRRGCSRSSGSASSPGRRRLRPLRRRRAVLRDRRGRGPRRREPRRRGLRLRAHVLDLDDHRGVPQPTGRLGEGIEAGSRPRPSRSQRSSTSPKGSARSSA